MENGVDPTTIGAFVTIILAFLGVAKIMLNGASKERESDRDERKEERLAFQAALDNLAEAQREAAQVEAVSRDKQTQALERTANEAEARNGHLAEIAVENKDQIIAEIRGLTIEKQTVHNQIVENEKVINKE